MIPETTREQILAAMVRFDREQRDTPEWAGWEGRGTQRYVLVHEGRRYPPKQIIALATGAGRSSFGGGNETNNYLAARGLTVVPISPARESNIWWVNQGNTYEIGRTGGFIRSPYRDDSGNTPVHWRMMQEVRAGDIFVHYADRHIRAIGRASADSTGVEAPSGDEQERATWTVPGWRAPVEYYELRQPIPLARVAPSLRGFTAPHAPFDRNGGVKQGYLWRFNREGLRVLREASDEPWPEWAEEPQPATRRSWVFQAVPERYDLVGALAALVELTWGVVQHPQDIHTGDTIYLWESGERVGIVAVATVLTEPADIVEDEDEARFNRTAEESAGARRGVRLQVDRVLPRRITKQELLAHPVLKGMKILTLPRGTNFDMTEEQAEAMRALTADKRPRRIVKIAPGEGARFWPDCLAGSYICIGWDDVGDLRKFPSQDDFLTAFRIHYPPAGSVSANGLWSLLALEPGDLIVANRGKEEVLGVGEVVAPGYEWHPERPDFKHIVRVRWDTSAAGRIPIQHGWMRTIVPVSPELYAEIIGTLPPVRPPEPIAPPQHLVSFEALLHALEEEGLAYAPEVVSNYLLALQTKRLVIFTGISGTGKTRLAQAVARAFQPRVRVAKAAIVPDGALDVEVKPYMTKYHRMVLPVDFADGMILPPVDPATSGGQIAVSYPGGQVQLSFRRDQRNVTEVYFKGAFRAWFAATARPGVHILLEAVEGASDAPHGLRFSLPRIETHEELLDNVYIAAVRPDWTDNRGLLGYFNPLTGTYARTPFLDLLLRAREEEEAAGREHRPARPFFAILDEMNLARVEHYFSDFLSALESGEPLHLHGDERIERGEGAEAEPVPRQLPVPGNVFFTGTVNVDETTYMFSPKVLDRAFTTEFNRVDLRGFGTAADSPSDGTGGVPAATVELAHFPGILLHGRKPEMTDWDALGALDDGHPRELVVALHDLLAEDGRHFGYRVAVEIARYVVLASEQAGDDAATLLAALDLAILQKVLPKFHGTQQEMEATLTALLDFAIHGARRDARDSAEEVGRRWRVGRDGHLRAATPDSTTPLPALPRTAAKLWGMLRRLRQQGFASFIE